MLDQAHAELTADPRDPPGRRRAGDHHGRRPRPRGRRPAAPAPRHRPGRRHLRRPAGLRTDRRVRRLAPTRGSSRSGWCPRASTSRGCGSASTPPTPSPSCSSARPSAGWCGGRVRCGARRRSSSSPTTSRLRTFAAQLAEQRTHSLRRREQDGRPAARSSSTSSPLGEAEDQLSLFEAISATPLDDGDPSSIFDDAHPDDLIHDAGRGPRPRARDRAGRTAAAVRRGRDDAGDGRVLTVSRTQRKRELRQANTDRVVMLTHLTGLDPQVDQRPAQPRRRACRASTRPPSATSRSASSSPTAGSTRPERRACSLGPLRASLRATGDA